MKTKDFKEELTTDMHSEFTISDEDEMFCRCITIWCLVGVNSDEHLKELCKSYSVPFDVAIANKDTCLKLKQGN